jgi:hypothetical protein
VYARLKRSRNGATGGGGHQIPRAAGLLVLAALLATCAGLSTRGAAAQAGSLRVDPPSQSVAAGQSFKISIIQTADFPSLGAAATLQFDPNVVQVAAVEVGPPYADALFLFGGGAGGAQSPEQAIADANTTGLLPNITTLFLPGVGGIPPGEAVIAIITMSGHSGGTSPLNLVTYTPPGAVSDANSLGIAADPPNEQGNLVAVSISPGEVSVAGGGGGGGGGGAPVPTATAAAATSTATPSPAALAARADPNAAATVSVAAASSQTITVGGEGKVELKVKANVKTSGAETDISFDKSIIQVTKVETGGGAWKKAEVQAGTGSQKMEQALTDANSKGELKSVGVALLTATGSSGGAAPASSPSTGASPTPAASPAAVAPAAAAASASAPASSASAPTAGTKTPSASAQAGTEEAFLVLTVKGLKNGETEVKLKNAKVIDENKFPIKVTAQNGKVVVGEGGGGGGFNPVLPIAGLFVIGGLGVGGYFAYRAMKRRREAF